MKLMTSMMMNSGMQNQNHGGVEEGEEEDGSVYEDFIEHMAQSFIKPSHLFLQEDVKVPSRAGISFLGGSKKNCYFVTV